MAETASLRSYSIWIRQQENTGCTLWIRLDSGNMSDNQKVFMGIDSILHVKASEENRRYAD